MRVLLVDDEESLRMTLAANLELEGFEVVEAADAGQALAALGAGPTFDLVLSDIRMPGMDGVDLYQAIRKQSPTVPVVLMTGFALEQRIAQATSDGVYAVLSKPFPVERVAPALTRVAKGPVILVLDDAPDVREHLLALLSSVGLRARAVADEEAALATLREGGVDVCLVDLVLPARCGAEVIEDLRRRAPEVVCIALSGFDRPDVVNKALTGGAVAFVPKPVDGPSLLSLIARARARQLVS